jgi:hypothetical protein
MPLPTFTFKQVEAILAHVFNVAPGKRRTFTARLQQLQKLGLPSGTNVGRGARAVYETWHLAELQLYLDLLNVGLTPATIADNFEGYGFYLDERHQAMAECYPAVGIGAYLRLEVRAIEHLSRGEGTASDQTEGAHLTVTAGFNRLLQQPNSTPAIVIALSERLAVLREAIGIVQPGATIERLFPDVSMEFEE